MLSPSCDTVTSRLTRRRHVEASDKATTPERSTLSFLPLAEWDEYNSYDEVVLSRLRYTIDWKVATNNKVVCKDTEQDVVESASIASASTSQGQARGSSATERMLADWVRQLDAEQSSRASSVWRDVYALMRCPGQPCNLGPHCWRDSFGQKHYRLRTHHLKALVKLVQQGCVLDSHDAVPEDIRSQLYTKEQQRHKRRSTAASAATPGFPPIMITSVMPSLSSGSPSTPSTGSTPISKHLHSDRASLDIPRPCDVAVLAYSEWQRLNVVDEAQRAEYQKACDATLWEMLDLEQVYEDQDADFYI